jgi:uncharacterized membrane protein
MICSVRQRFNYLNLLLAILLSVSLWLALFNWARAEFIEDFTVDLVVNDDGTMLVQEKILYQFDDGLRHGIKRNIKDTAAQPADNWFKDRYLKFKLDSVKRNGVAEPYVIEEYEGLSIKIGDEEKLISGTQSYEITYLVEGGISVYPDLTELYWNVTGDEWPVLIKSSNVTLSTNGLGSLNPDQFCYKGPAGSSVPCDSLSIASNTAVFGATYLVPGHQLTFAQSLTLPKTPVVWERINWARIYLSGFLLVLTLLVYFIYKWQTHNRQSTTIIAQYEPLENFKPMFTGVLLDNRLDSKDITAGIMYLAQQGFIAIKQIKDKEMLIFDSADYEVTLLRSGDEVETDFDRNLLELIFGYSGSVSNNLHVNRAVLLSSVAKKRGNQNAAAISLMKSGIENELVSMGYIEQRLSRSTRIIILTMMAVLFFYLFPSLLNIGFISALIYVLINIFGVFILVFLAERRTQKGYEVLNYIEGFKKFLAVTDAERFNFHNSPDLSPQKFMEYLPYAIAFGVEKEWASVFKDIQFDDPDWYSSNEGGHSFSAVNFLNSLNSFTRTIVSATYRPASGRAGSFGRGFSGGGGGGGGGRSW